MRLGVVALVLSAFSSPAVAATTFPADRIIAAASGDWNQDGTPDFAVIAAPEGEDDNGIYIYLAKPDEARLSLALALPNSIWGSLVMYGQEPELAVLPNGSLSIVTKNESIGRNRWRQTLTIAYRNFDFVVAGYTFSAYDTIAEDGMENETTECDLNVLTGKGKLDGRPIAVKAALITLKEWNDSIGQKACGRSE
jgi:hypothetical protein